MQAHHRILPALLALQFLAFPPAATATPSPAQIEARSLMTLMGGTAFLDRVFDAMRGNLVAILSQTGHIEKSKAEQLTDQLLLPALRAHSSELLDAKVALYAQYFTVEEIQQMEAFYRTPVGQKSLAVAPKMTAELSAFARAWGARVGRQAIQDHIEELRKQGVKL